MLAVLLFASACQASDGRESDEPDASAPAPGETALVTWIRDGDTFEAETTDGIIEVRLIGINAPDRGECLYDEATDHLIEILKGDEVILEIVGIDQFGRTLAHVFSGDDHLNVELVEDGMAIATTPEEEDVYGAGSVAAEEEAWLAKVGIWAEDACGPSSPLPDLDIISVVSDPHGPDDEVLDNETVTIVNRGGQQVNLTGWILRDESSRHRYRFRNGEKIAAGQELTISSGDPGWSPGGSPVWNNDGDMALLLDKHGRVVARERY